MHDGWCVFTGGNGVKGAANGTPRASPGIYSGGALGIWGGEESEKKSVVGINRVKRRSCGVG